MTTMSDGSVSGTPMTETIVDFLCAVCAHRAAVDVVSYSSCPAFLFPLPPELAPNVVRAPLTLVACRRCGHFQRPEVDADVQLLIYEVYYSHYEIDSLETMIPSYREPFNCMIESLAADGLMPEGRLLAPGGSCVGHGMSEHEWTHLLAMKAGPDCHE
jgi:hypothetical protein